MRWVSRRARPSQERVLMPEFAYSNASLSFPDLYRIKVGGVALATIVGCIGGCLGPALRNIAPTLGASLIGAAVLPVLMLVGLGVVNGWLRFAWWLQAGTWLSPWALRKQVAQCPEDYIAHAFGYGQFGYVSPDPAVIVIYRPTGRRSAILICNRSSIRILEESNVELVWHPVHLHRPNPNPASTSGLQN